MSAGLAGLAAALELHERREDIVLVERAELTHIPPRSPFAPTVRANMAGYLSKGTLRKVIYIPGRTQNLITAWGRQQAQP